MRNTGSSPKVVVREADAVRLGFDKQDKGKSESTKWLKCSLEVSKRNLGGGGGGESEHIAWEARIRLLTGRTHQIRSGLRPSMNGCIHK